MVFKPIPHDLFNLVASEGGRFEVARWSRASHQGVFSRALYLRLVGFPRENRETVGLSSTEVGH